MWRGWVVCVSMATEEHAVIHPVCVLVKGSLASSTRVARTPASCRRISGANQPAHVRVKTGRKQRIQRACNASSRAHFGRAATTLLLFAATACNDAVGASVPSWLRSHPKARQHPQQGRASEAPRSLQHRLQTKVPARAKEELAPTVQRQGVDARPMPAQRAQPRHQTLLSICATSAGVRPFRIPTASSPPRTPPMPDRGGSQRERSAAKREAARGARAQNLPSSSRRR